jgi:hypothetical protein
MPLVHAFYFDELTSLESRGKICLVPTAVLERYHMNLKKRIQERAKKHARK